MDFVGACVEEVALEGLDGITLDSLWLRLQTRVPQFSLPLDEHCKQFLWSSALATDSELEFYELPVERKPLVLTDRFDQVSEETGVILEEEYREDIYPIKEVENTKAHVLGSCATYDRRKLVTSLIRTDVLMPCLTLKQVVQRWGERLAIVASQRLRSQAICGEEKRDLVSQMSLKTYIMLERIARSRTHGEVTHGNNSLKCLGINAKTLFYQRRLLELKHLIVTQNYNSRTLTGQNMGGRLMHIPRFYVKRETRYCVWKNQVYELLKSKPRQMMVLTDLRTELNVSESAFKHFLRAIQSFKIVESFHMAKADIYPDQDLGMTRNGKSRGDTKVKVVRLLPGYDASIVSEESEEEEEDEDPGSDVEILVMEKPLIVQVYELMLKVGGKGVRQTDVKRKIGLNKLDSRSVMRYLERLDLCHSVLQDQGKQRVIKYVASEVQQDCQLIRRLNKEKQLVLDQRCKDESMDTTLSLPVTDSPLPVSTELLDTTQQSSDGSIVEQASVDSGLSTLYSIAPEFIDLHRKTEGNLTYRWLRRANIILETLNDIRMVDGVVLLRRKIMAIEEIEGLKTTVDRKSVLRIVYKLHEAGHVGVIKPVLEIAEGSSKQVELFLQKDVKESDVIVTSYLETQTQKLKALINMQTERMKGDDKSWQENQFSMAPCDAAQLNHALLSSKTLIKDLIHSPKSACAYGFKPKMRRAEVLHKFLWYIVYGYDLSELDEIQYTDREMDFSSYPTTSMTAQSHSQTGNPIPDKILSTFKVYHDAVGWRRFIPPVQTHKGFPSGWFQTGDILLVMPVSIFVALVRIPYKIPGLMEILRDPVRRHVTVSQLPSTVRQMIMFQRHYLFKISAALQQLCYLGLLSFGGREHREKQQVYCYLHEKATIMNTTHAAPERHLHEFSTYSEVTNYWYELQYTAINTPHSSLNLSDPIEMKTSAKVNEHYKDCLKPIEPWKEKDLAVIPGDSGGACGMDSCQFLHLKRNWYWSYDKDVKLNSLIEHKGVTRKTQPRKKALESTGVGAKGEGQSIRKIGSGAKDTESTERVRTLHRKKKRKRKTSVRSITTVADEFEKVKVCGEEAVPKRGGKGVKRRAKDEIQPSAEKKVKKSKEKHDHYRSKEYKMDSRGKIVALRGYDKVDERILEKRLRDRVIWSDEEDSLLLMCVVTQRVLIYPRQRRDIVLSYFILRDLLHDLLPRFKNKSSKAIQRRIHYIMKNEETHNNTEVFVGEAMHDTVVQTKVKGLQFSRAMPESELEKVFRDVYLLLRKRFSLRSVSAPLSLPDTVKEIQTSCDISGILSTPVRRFEEVCSNTDICFWVLHNTIHCSMLLSDRTGRAHELFQLFNQYPEDLLLRVFSCMKVDGLITKFKSFQSTPRALPWNKISLGNPGLGGYQVSQRYMYNWFAKQYPRNVFESTSGCLNEFLESPEEPRNMEERGGFTAVTVALMALRQIRFTTVIPENVITIIPRFEKQHDKKGTSKVLDPDDAEEDALIEEAVKARNQAKVDRSSAGGSTEPLPQTESHIEFQESQRSTSRFVANLMHQTYYGFAAVNNYNPDNLLVVHECSISVQLKSESVTHQDTSNDRHKDLELRVKMYLTNYNHTRPFLHPHTAQEILKGLRLSYPREVDNEGMIQDCQTLHGYTESQLSELRYLNDVVKETGSLGLEENSLLVSDL